MMSSLHEYSTSSLALCVSWFSQFAARRCQSRCYREVVSRTKMGVVYRVSLELATKNTLISYSTLSVARVHTFQMRDGWGYASVWFLLFSPPPIMES